MGLAPTFSTNRAPCRRRIAADAPPDRCRHRAEEILGAPASFRRFGVTPVSEVNILMDNLGLRNLFGDSGIDVFAWLEAGYSGASSGSGPLRVQPRLNRFGNEFLLSDMGFTIDKPLRQEDEFDLGFFVRYFAGANAATGQPKGGIGSTVTSTRFSA